MKHFISLAISLIPLVAYADSSGEEIFKSATIGAATLIFLGISVGIYKLGKFIFLKIMPTAPLWMQRIAGTASLIVSYGLLASVK